MFLPIRYADDFVVLVTGTEEQARNEKEELATFLADELKLTLSPEKTHVTPLTEGFIFLGHRVRLRWDDRWGYWPRLEIPKDRTKDLCRRVKALTTRAHRNLPLREVIAAVNPLLRGWGRFCRHCHGAKAVFSRIDHWQAAEEVPSGQRFENMIPPPHGIGGGWNARDGRDERVAVQLCRS